MLSKTGVHGFHTLELKIALRPVRSGKGREGSIHKTIHDSSHVKSPENPEILFSPATSMSNVNRTRLRRNDPRFAFAMPAYFVLYQRQNFVADRVKRSNTLNRSK